MADKTGIERCPPPRVRTAPAVVQGRPPKPSRLGGIVLYALAWAIGHILASTADDDQHHCCK